MQQTSSNTIGYLPRVSHDNANNGVNNLDRFIPSDPTSLGYLPSFWSTSSDIFLLSDPLPRISSFFRIHFPQICPLTPFLRIHPLPMIPSHSFIPPFRLIAHLQSCHAIERTMTFPSSTTKHIDFYTLFFKVNFAWFVDISYTTRHRLNGPRSDFYDHALLPSSTTTYTRVDIPQTIDPPRISRKQSSPSPHVLEYNGFPQTADDRATGRLFVFELEVRKIYNTTCVRCCVKAIKPPC